MYDNISRVVLQLVIGGFCSTTSGGEGFVSILPLWFGGSEFSQRLPLYKLSYTTGLLHAWILACSEAYEFGQFGTGLSWFR